MNSRPTRIRTNPTLALILLALGASGCGHEADDDGPPARAQQAAAPKTELVAGLGDAENATFSDDGRLFVTGGENVYELETRETGFVATPLYAGKCNFTGVVTHGDHLYATCVEGTELANLKPHLVGGSLRERPTSVRVIHDFTVNKFPNGIAFDDTGRLFATDFSPLGGKIVTLTLATPLQVAREEVWSRGGLLVNGLKIFRQQVYVTDSGSIKVIPIAPDGRAGRPLSIASRLSVFDDLLVDADGIIAADFLGRTLAFYSHSGRLLRETPPIFDTPSSITRARGPLFPTGGLIVTEKGALNELTSNDGNRVSLYVP